MKHTTTTKHAQKAVAAEFALLRALVKAMGELAALALDTKGGHGEHIIYILNAITLLRTVMEAKGDPLEALSEAWEVIDPELHSHIEVAVDVATILDPVNAAAMRLSKLST